MGRQPGRARGALEGEILACLAAAGRPLSPGEVRDVLRGGLAYTTVMTTLARLYEKGALDRGPRGRAYVYSLSGGPEGFRANVTAHQMLKLLDVGSDRSRVLTRFVADLAPEDEKLIIDLLRQPSDASS